MVTDVTVDDILKDLTDNEISNNESRYSFSEINSSRDNTVNISDITQPASGISKRMFTRYRYWENGLTGKNSAIDGTVGSAGEGTGTHGDNTEPENAIMSYVGGQLHVSRTWKSYNDNLGNSSGAALFFTKLTTYSSPIKIIDPSNVNTSDYTDITKAHPFLEIYLQVPTISTRQSKNDISNSNLSGNTTGTDNIGFFNPVMKQSLGDVEGMKYVIRGWGGDDWENLNIEIGGDASNKNILYYLNNPGFILCYGVTNIDNGYRLSYRYPPVISFIRYTGETFSDGIISQGDTLPAVEVSNLKDLFINTTENTIHRLDINGETKEWIGIGGSGGGSFMPVSEELSVSGDIYYNQGNVGIGTDSPTALLHVDGKIKSYGGLSSVYRLPEQNIVWSHNHKITASDAAGGDKFGKSVAISGNYAIVGAQFDDDPSNSGSAYIFERNSSGNWAQSQKLTASDGAVGDNFGKSVAISGNYAIVGALFNGDVPNASGSAYIFERNSDGTWNQNETKKLTASDAASDNWFGLCVAISGNYAIVGAPNNDNNKGSVYIFERNSDGTWNQNETQKLTASDRQPDNEFGWSVAISGNYVIVGAHYNDDNGGNSGCAYIFERGADGNWEQKQKLTASDAAANDKFGESVAISGNYVIVGASYDDTNGSAYIFERNSDGNWEQKQKLTASDPAYSDDFGESVAISGNYAIVGAKENDDDGDNTGSAYIFKRNSDGTWTQNQTQKLTASDAADGDLFGHSVAISENYAIVSAPGSNDDGADSGSAYIFETPSFEQEVFSVGNEKVCIGTSSPQTKLHVNGDIKVTGTMQVFLLETELLIMEEIKI